MDKCHIFNNGRIFVIKDKYCTEVAEQEKEILICCKGCATVFGTKESHYSYNIENKILSSEDLKRFHSVIITDGIKIYMKTGNPATLYYDRFIDCNTKYKEYIKMQDTNSIISKEQFEKMKYQIDIDKTLSEITGDSYIDQLETRLAVARLLFLETNNHTTR